MTLSCTNKSTVTNRRHQPNRLAIAISCSLISVAAINSANSQSTRLIELSDLNGSNGFTLRGIDIDDEAGSSVSTAGDFNGDGLEDIVIGTRIGFPANQTQAGEAYVVFGQNTGSFADIELSDLDGNNGFVIRGINADDQLGNAVGLAGDVNDDGLDDLVLGARNADRNGLDFVGEAYVIFGTRTPVGPTFDLSNLDGDNGFVIRSSKGRAYAGTSVNAAGDINGDDIDDLIIGANRASVTGLQAQGESYVIFGQKDGFSASLELSSLDGNNGFTVQGIDVYDASGISVDGAGDINGDGMQDIVIGGYLADLDNAPGASAEGEAYVVFGQKSGYPALLELSTIDGNNGFIVSGREREGFLGRSVSRAGDVNADGIDDLIVGAPAADGGEAYLIFGQTTPFAAELNVTSLDGTNGTQILSNPFGPIASGGLGQSVSAAGDFNADGIDDVIIGANFSGPGFTGQSFVVFGSGDGFPGSFFIIDDYDSVSVTAINGVVNPDASGTSVNRAGDFNNDGVDDVIIGAPRPNTLPEDAGPGEAYVVFGIPELIFEDSFEFQ